MLKKLMINARSFNYGIYEEIGIGLFILSAVRCALATTTFSFLIPPGSTALKTDRKTSRLAETYRMLSWEEVFATVDSLRQG